MVKGGSYLTGATDPESVFTPEDFSEEDRMVAAMVADFTRNEILPVTGDIEAQAGGLMQSLMEKAGGLGILSADIPGEYGGGDMSKIVSAIIAENVSLGGSFAVAFGAHTGIGTLPIVFFGNDEQKAKYLPDLASGKKLAAFGLTEPGAGSDALAARTRAVLSPDGRHYLLSGEKIFITNGGTAEVFVVFAKIDGEKFTAFIVDRDTPGFTTGAEEHKLGIKGSSTRSLIFEDAPVPVENVLYEPGRGASVALGVLDIGRFKLAAGAMGSAKGALEVAVRYAQQREQFKTPLVKFGLIQEKLARMAARTYAAESAVYRTAGLLEEALHGTTGAATIKGMEEYAVECSVNKNLASEVLDYVVDQTLQIHGGYGYIAEYAPERFYRDARINRIFEGTNEINRLIIPGTLLRRAAKGEIPLLQAAQALARDIFDLQPGLDEDGLLAAETRMVDNAKKMFLMVGGSAAQKYLDKIAYQQEVMGLLADMVIEIFAMDSAVARALKARDGGIKALLARSYVHDVFPRFELWGKKVLAHIAGGDELRTQLAVLKRLSRYEPCDTIALDRTIAERVAGAGGYVV
jgi:alkylation response protein AidB-like acyl-CoA dehydrogenase